MDAVRYSSFAALTLFLLLKGIVAAEMRPNVVMIISDDQAYRDFGFMGNEIVQTPNIDKLASRSTLFRNGYVTASVCRPSLVTLLTGLYPHQHGVHFNHPPPGFSKLTRTLNRTQYEAAREAGNQLIRNVPTLPRILAESGYRCLQTGKYWEGHWSGAGFTDGMTTGTPHPGAKYGNKQLANGQWVAHGNGDAGLAIGRQTMKPIEDFLAQTEDEKEPAFIWYAPFLPHLPHNSPQRFQDLYDDSVPEHLRRYYAACSEFDATVGKLIELVTRYQTRPTLYVFVVDNGYSPDSQKPMRDGFGFNYTHRSKRSPFEDGLRTPILVCLDGVTKAKTIDSLVSSVDIVPTVLQATGQKIPASMKGNSLWDMTTGNTTIDANRAVFGAVYPGDASELGNPSCDVAYRWMRKGDWKLIVPHSQRGQIWRNYADRDQLFDLSEDPDERMNLATNPDYRREFEALRMQLDQWWQPVSE